MARTDPQVNIRLPERLLERLRDASQASGKSLTAEIVDRLESSFPKRFDLAALEARQRDLVAIHTQLDALIDRYRRERETMTEMERRRTENEIEIAKASLKNLWEELDSLYAQLRKPEVEIF